MGNKAFFYYTFMLGLCNVNFEQIRQDERSVANTARAMDLARVMDSLSEKAMHRRIEKMVRA
jgi:hypothetical protein